MVDASQSGLAGFLNNLAGQVASDRQAAAYLAAYEGQPQPQGLIAKLFGVGTPDQSAAGAPMQLQGATSTSAAPVPGQATNNEGGGSRVGTIARLTAAGATPDLAPPGAPSAPPSASAAMPPAAMSYAPTTPMPQSAAPRASAPQQSPVGNGAVGGPLPMFAASQGVPTGAGSNAQQALAFYQSKGLSPMASAALVGGFTAESTKGLNPTALAVGDGSDGSNSVGIAQWNGDRAQGLKQFAAANGLNPADINTQLQYSWAELNGPEKGTLAALQQAQNPVQATAAALGYERPAGWSATNPLGAKTFGQRLQATAALSSGGGVNGSPAPLRPQSPFGTLNPAAFAQPLAMIASGQGMALSPATASFASSQNTAPPGGSMGASATGAPQPIDANGNALGYAPPGQVAAAPASQAIAAAAAPADPSDPPVSLPGFKGTWTRASAAATEADDSPEIDAVAAAQKAAAAPESLATPAKLGGVVASGQQASAPAATNVGSAPAAAPTTVVQPSPPAIDTIKRLLSDSDTAPLGVELWKSMLTRQAPAFQHIELPDGRVLAFNPATGGTSLIATGTPSTDAIKNYTFAQSQGYSKSFTDYQGDQQKADKAQLIDVPLANGQMQKVWATPGQDPTQGTPVGQPYTKRPDTAISIDNKGEGAEAQEAGKLAATRRGDMLAAADAAPDKIARLNLLGAVLDRTQTGPLAGAAGTVVNVANSLGISPDAISALGLNPNQAVDNQIAQKLANELVMGSIGAKNGGFPASNFSVAERQFIEKTFPNIAAQPGANQAVNDVLVAREQRNIEKGDAWSAYKQQQKAASQPVSYEDFEGQWQQQHSGDNIFAPIQQRFIAGGYGPVGTLPAQPNPTNQPAQSPRAAAQPGPRVQVRGAADYRALPSGTPYTDPNGVPRVKP